MGRDVSAGFNFFNTSTNYNFQAGLETRVTGLGLSFGFPLSEDGRLSLFFNLSEDELKNTSLSAGVNPSYTDFKSQFGYFYAIDKRDDVIEPTDGWNFGFGQDIAGPIGDVSFLRTTLSASYYHELAEGYIFNARANMGVVHDYKGGVINYNDRLFKGGSSFAALTGRGRPAPVKHRLCFGANKFLIGPPRLLPLGIPKEVGMRANAFVDFGVWGIRILCRSARRYSR